MSAELALMNQILHKSLTQNAAAGETTFKVPVVAGSMDIHEGDNLQIAPNGDVYPNGYRDAGTSEIVTGTNTFNYTCTSFKAKLDNDTYCAYDSVASKFTIFKYDTASGLFKILTTIALPTAIHNWAYCYPKKLKDGVIGVYYPQDTDNLVFCIISYDNNYTMSVAYTNTNILTDSYSLMSTIAKLDDTRILMFSYRSGVKYNVFELSDDNLSISHSSLNNSTSDAASNIYYGNVIDYEMTGVVGTYLGYNSYVTRVTPSSSSGTGVSFSDETNGSDTDDSIVSLSFYGSTHHNIPYDSEAKLVLTYLTNTGSNSVLKPDYGSLVLIEKDPDYATELKKTIYRQAPGTVTPNIYANATAWQYAGNSIWYMYSTYYNSDGSYKHKLYKFTLDPVTTTFTVSLEVEENFSDTSTTNHGDNTAYVTITSGGELVAGCALYSNVYESVRKGGESVFYTPVKLIASTDIAANANGIAISQGKAFEQTGKSAGANYLNAFIITSTNYAVELN